MISRLPEVQFSHQDLLFSEGCGPAESLNSQWRSFTSRNGEEKFEINPEPSRRVSLGTLTTLENILKIK